MGLFIRRIFLVVTIKWRWQYRGRLDESGVWPSSPDAKRELIEAMLDVAKTGKGPLEQRCSIKWL
ncbi:MAG: hypothetical protein COB62_04975 [Piscirickettsiaceae bacterium]|nr:MAG: hypothetical protein COB62_04975 [Piscirickettsiaceae bacterium]